MSQVITISKISVDSIGSRIKQLEQDWNKSFRSIEFIQNSILIGFEQSPDFVIGNAYCQKAGHLVNTVNKFSPDKAKKAIAFFEGKIPFPILSRDGEYRLGKLNWDLMKTPDELEQAQTLKIQKQKERNDKTAANAAEKKAKLAAFDTLTKRVDEKDDELKKLKLENDQLKQGLSPELLAEVAKAEKAKAEAEAKADIFEKRSSAEKAKAEKALADAKAEKAKAEKVKDDYDRLQAAYTIALQEIAELKGQLKEARQAKA